MQGPSQSSILDLRAITAEHADRFSKEGKTATKGVKRPHKTDPFDRPNPGLVKRLAAEARNDAKRRNFGNDAGPSDEQRRLIMEEKARKYDALSRGDYSGLTERERAEAVIDFDKKREEESDDSDEESDDDDEKVEYVDELGRTRWGTKAEAEAANPAPPENSSYADVMRSKVIHGDQNFFPVYEPDPNVLRAKYLEAEEESRQKHYDASKEVRTKAAGQYQFSLDEETRARQMEELKAGRLETERARERIQSVLEQRNQKLEARRQLVEAKRVELAGGVEALEAIRAKQREAAADSFLDALEEEIGKGKGTA
ncbi:uncharacterized protein MKK02DRAFT_41995 [Dioszegia hungarica]|uniref:Uncharacterized protein n=1 Tax=Dioszegia hungarica TaxID=4972 RepID=A0AA38HGE4_9TREE|nr:uncharacterized protein MKK02DRAFT_41995 [Dioszegia hungarica]KAI9638966.1 hypothetical protein MKK02DRAFT_41995 [Dioszegia hungarica]